MKFVLSLDVPLALSNLVNIQKLGFFRDTIENIGESPAQKEERLFAYELFGKWRHLPESFRGSEIHIIYILRQSFTDIIETNAKNGFVLEATRIENSFKRASGEVEDPIIIYIGHT